MNHSYKDFFNAAKSAKKGHLPAQTKRKAMPSTKTIQKTQKSKPRKKTPLFPIVPTLSVIIGFLLAGWGYLNLDEVHDFIGRVQISPLQSLEASEKKSEEKSPEKVGNQANNTESTKVETPPETKNSEAISSEDIRHFSRLTERKKELDQRENELNELERELHEQRKEIEVRIRKLEEIREQIGKVLKEKVQVDEERVAKLVEFYSNMKPQNAAKIVATLNEDLAVEILGRMKKKNAAEILNLLKSDKAQVLTEKFAGYKRR
ncbi:MAG: hypothetical protein H6625_06345 [Bdellovibrionaceae bacterium]|nr:hypothetical protein [Pseudobdellovibrionaceae bacterium]